jgi:hypothetical protein
VSTLNVFDLDNTLAEPDHELDLQHNYLLPEWRVFPPEMWKIFENAPEKMILTTRHPSTEPIIRRAMHVDCHICCRNFCLEDAEILAVGESAVATEIFLGRMVKWKASVLNELADNYDQVTFWDDMADKFRFTEVRDNVDIRLPVHLSGLKLEETNG